MDLTKFQEELAKTNNTAIKKVANYLLSREDIHRNLEKENKSLNEMWNYIVQEAQNVAVNNCASVEDDTVFGWAVHYYDEDNIKVEKKISRTNADGSITSIINKTSKGLPKTNEKVIEKVIDQEAIDKAVKAAIENYSAELKKKDEEKKVKEKKRKEEAKKKKEEEKAMKEALKNEGQSSIFDFLGDENGL